MTQADLARILDIPFQSISQWERDIRNPKQETLQRIADALSVQLIELTPQSVVNAFFAGYNSHLHTKRYHSANTDEEAEEAEYDAQDLFWYFDELDAFGQKRVIAFARALAGYDPIAGMSPPHSIDLAITTMYKLNEAGQQKAVERLEELAEIPKYQSEKAPDATNIQD